MEQLAKETSVAFERRLERAGVPAPERAHFHKWARFYLDFCRKYGHPPRSASSLGPFLTKLAAKNQSVAQREQAARAVRLLIGPSPQPPPGAGMPTMAGQRGAGAGQGDKAPMSLPGGVAQPPRATALAVACAPSQAPAHAARPPLEGPARPPPVSAAPVRVPGRGASWQQEYRDLEAAILLRSYSSRTLEAYRFWLAKFQAFVRSRPTAELGTQEVRGFLSELAVRHGVAASTQNQAFGAVEG